MPRRTWTDDDLKTAVARSANLHQVFVALDLRVGGGAWATMKDHIVRLGLDTSHWDAGAARPDGPGPRPAVPDWSDAEVRDAAAGARSVAQVMGRLGLDPDRKRGRSRVVRRLREVGVDPDRLPGQGWSAGRRVVRARRPLEELLVRDRHVSTSTLRQRLVAEGVLPARCAWCGRERWLGERIPLQLDHVDGDRTNNLLENLRLLCPNCHALTDTYCGRNIGRR